jgi:hypothetical protein
MRTAPKAPTTSMRWTASRSTNWWPPAAHQRGFPHPPCSKRCCKAPRAFSQRHGSEYVNHQVAKLLNQAAHRRVPKSRSRHRMRTRQAGRRTRPSAQALRLQRYPAMLRRTAHALPRATRNSKKLIKTSTRHHLPPVQRAGSVMDDHQGPVASRCRPRHSLQHHFQRIDKSKSGA